jgi:hypothetical protein
MSGPTFSDDGNWMWNGYEWVPAPSQSQIIPQSALNMQQISSAANNAGVSQDSLRNAAPYFDHNVDGRLQSNELQQAVNYVSNPVPSSPVPQQDGGYNQYGRSPQSNYVPQTQYVEPIIYNSSSRKPKSGGSSLLTFGIIFLVLIIAGAGFGVYYVSEYSTSDSSSSDSNNVDLDLDGIDNSDDSCPDGETGWTSSYSTDNDGDGCRDSTEDTDDDNDGKSDSYDDCPSGFTGWTSSSYTDFDSDGCQDYGEDNDDDNDGYSDSNDWFDRGDGYIMITWTEFNSNYGSGEYDFDDSAPDPYGIVRWDVDCDGDYEYTYNQLDDDGYYPDKWSLDQTILTVYRDIPESNTEFCWALNIMDYDSDADDALDYVDQSDWKSYYFTDTLSQGMNQEESYSDYSSNRGIGITFVIEAY